MSDIPYSANTERKSENSYDNEKFDWPLEMHKDFVTMVNDIDGKTECKILICNYNSPTYDKLIEKEYWHKIKVKRLPSPGNGKGKRRKIKTEYVYVNYDNYSSLAKYTLTVVE